MSIPVPPPDQSHDNLLRQRDLPEGWYPHRLFPGDREVDPSLEIDELRGYDRWMTHGSERYRVAVSDLNETIDGRWRNIELVATHTRVMIRL